MVCLGMTDTAENPQEPASALGVVDTYVLAHALAYFQGLPIPKCTLSPPWPADQLWELNGAPVDMAQWAKSILAIAR